MAAHCCFWVRDIKEVGGKRRKGQRISIIDPMVLAGAAVLMKLVLWALGMHVCVCVTDNSCKYPHLECLHPGD